MVELGRKQRGSLRGGKRVLGDRMLERGTNGKGWRTKGSEGKARPPSRVISFNGCLQSQLLHLSRTFAAQGKGWAVEGWGHGEGWGQRE